jgi:hypothetical protein
MSIGCTLYFRETDGFRAVAMHGAPPAYLKERLHAFFPATVTTGLGRVVQTKQVVHIEDVTSDEGAGFRFSQLDDAAFEFLILGVGAQEATVEFSDCCPLFEVRPPVLCRPAVATGSQHGYDLGLVPPEFVEDSSWRLRSCLEREIVTVEGDFDAAGAGDFYGVRCAHMRPLQPTDPTFSNSD